MRVQRVRPSERFFVTPFFESTAPTLARHVRDLMATDILATSPDATPYEVAQAMIQERVDLLPVVDRDLKVVGVVSEGDLLNRVNFPHGTILDGLKALFGRGNHRTEKSMSRRISDLMARDVQSISPDETIQDAAELMVKKGIRGLPVLDKDGHLIGMLTRRHVIQAMLQWSERETTQAP